MRVAETRLLLLVFPPEQELCSTSEKANYRGKEENTENNLGRTSKGHSYKNGGKIHYNIKSIQDDGGLTVLKIVQ